MNDNSLNLFFGQIASDDFLEDLEILKKLQEKEILELIDKAIIWYSKEDVNKEWDEWSKSFTKEEEKERKSVLRIIIFIFKEFVSDNVNEDELKEDFELLKISKNYFDHFIKSLKPIEKEFRKKILRDKKPYENALLNIDWRIDKKNYREGEEKNVAIIEFIYSDKGEKKVAQFGLNLKALKHLIYRLQKIQEELCKHKL